MYSICMYLCLACPALRNPNVHAPLEVVLVEEEEANEEGSSLEVADVPDWEVHC